MASDVRVQIMNEKNPVWQTVVWPLALQKPGLSDRGVANGVAKFRMASGRLKEQRIFSPELFENLRRIYRAGFWGKTVKLIFLWKSQIFFKKSSNFPEKVVNFSCDFSGKVDNFFQENWKFYDFLKKISRFSEENLKVFTGTFNDLDFPVKTVKFSCKNRQIFFKKS